MKRPKFVRVVNVPEPRAGSDSTIRQQGDVLKVGTVVPVEWFENTPDVVFAHLINPPSEGGLGVLVEHTPDTREMALLRDQYPEVLAEAPAPVSKSTSKKGATGSKKKDEDGD